MASAKNTTGISGKIKCTCCGKESPTGNYYESKSILYKDIGKLTVCKNCISNIFDDISAKYNERESIYRLCRKLDMPFHESAYEAAISHSKTTGWKIHRSYITKLNSLRKANRYTNDFEEGEKLGENQNSNNNIEDISDEIKAFWGKGLENWEYDFLETELYNLKNDFECDDYGMEMIMKDISFINLDIYKGRAENRDVRNLIKTRSELMNDGNLKPIQATGASQNEKMSLGVFIKKWENEKPIRKDLDDEMKKYIDTFMVGHLAKMQGLENEATKKYEESIQEETIDFSDIYDDQEEVDS